MKESDQYLPPSCPCQAVYDDIQGTTCGDVKTGSPKSGAYNQRCMRKLDAHDGGDIS